MMSESPNLVTTCIFKGKEYIVKMNVTNGNTLDLCVTDKFTAENWQCSYDASYIESITHKTGNFKQFDVFTTMLKSGLLKTSECVTLDLLTFDDLEMLRNQRIAGRGNYPLNPLSSNHVASTSNRRYLILTYTVEFDRIHYPLPMEYCGPPDPQVLQGIIRRLEGDVERLQEQLRKRNSHTENMDQMLKLESRIEELLSENKCLNEEVRHLNKLLAKRSSSQRQVEFMQNAMRSLEEQVLQERLSFQRLIQRLRDEKFQLIRQVEDLQSSDKCLRNRWRQVLRGTNASGTAVGPASSCHTDPLNVLSSRRPGDGLHSPLIDMAFETQSSKHKLAPRNPHMAKSLQDNNNFGHEKPAVVNTNRKPSPSQTRSVGLLPTSNLRHCRTSSESSGGSRKSRTCQGKVTLSNRKPVAGDTMKCSEPLQKRETNQERARQKFKFHQLRRRSTSDSSACSATRKQPEINHRKQVGRCSRQSSATSGCSQNMTTREGSSRLGNHKCTQTKKMKQRKKSQDIKLGMSDLEKRIEALQKLLNEGIIIK